MKKYEHVQLNKNLFRSKNKTMPRAGKIKLKSEFKY